MDISDYKQGDEIQILGLFETVFKQKLSLENWLWRFRDNPAGKYLIKLMWEKDKLIGHYAISPVIMNVDGQDVFTALSLTTMTHPDFGGQGVFKKLSSVMFKELENKLNCKAIWGFPNNNSHYGFIKRLNWTNLAVIHTLGINSTNVKPKGVSFKAKSIHKFDSSHEEFITKKVRTFAKTYIKRNTSYLNWRFIDKPNSNYRCYHFQSSSGQSVLMVKTFAKGNQNKYDLNIIDCFMDNYNEIHDYISYITDDLNVQFDRITLWSNLFSSEHLSLERQGFVPVLPQTYLASRINSSMPESFSDYRKWHVSMSDSDVF